MLRDRPRDVGLAPYGAKAIDPPPAQVLSLGAMMASPLRVLYEVRASHTFWILFATFFICGLSTNGLIQTHWVSLCGDYGVAPVAAAGALAAMGAFDFVGTILSGWLSDRYDNRWLLFVYYGLRGLSLLALPFTGFSVLGLSAFAVFYGLDWVATVPPTVRLTAERFGAEKANVTFGWIYAAHMLGRGRGRIGRRRLAHRVPDLPALALCRRRRLRDRRRAGADDGAAAGARGGGGGRVTLLPPAGEGGRRNRPDEGFRRCAWSPSPSRGPATCRASVARCGQPREKRSVRGEPAGYELSEEPHALRLACLALGEKPERSVHVQVGARRPRQ